MSVPGVRRGAPSSFLIAAALWASAFIIYQSTFVCAPRLFLFPEAGMAPADIPEYAAALRGRPNETDMRKHLLYYPLSRVLYRIADGARLRLGVNGDAVAQVFPGALYGATSVVLAYLLFLRFIGRQRPSAAAAACYAFMYSVWVFSSVPESYALTTLSVNLFLCAVFAGNAGPTRRWLGCLVAVISLSALCDARCLLLVIVPIYIVALSPEIEWPRKIGSVVFLLIGTLCLVGAVYGAYRRISGYEGFGCYALCTWLWRLGKEYTSFGHALDLRSATGVLLTFFVETLSPLYQVHMDESPAVVRAFHVSLACGFVAAGVLLLSGALRTIGKRLVSGVPVQGLACCLAVYILSHVVFSPESALHFSTPVVLPLLLLILPGIVDAWARRRYGLPVMCAAVACLMANNLVLVNEARSAWQAPDIVQSPDDRVYLLPGDHERLYYLVHKGAVMLPVGERERFLVLAAKSGSQLTKDEGREIHEIAFRAIGHLPTRERAEALDISRRNMEAFRISAVQR